MIMCNDRKMAKYPECLPHSLVICDVPNVVVAEPAHADVPELNVGAAEAKLHVVQAERIQRRQPCRGDSSLHETLQRLDNTKSKGLQTFTF